MKEIENNNTLAIDLIRAKSEQEIIEVLKKHGYYEEAKCDKCVRLLAARNAVIY